MLQSGRPNSATEYRLVLVPRFIGEISRFSEITPHRRTRCFPTEL